MGGRGRGRGRGASVSFNIEQLGFAKGEALPAPVTQPPPLFPPLENKPLPLHMDVEQEYLLVVRKDLNMRMRNSPFYLLPSASQRPDITNPFSHRLQTFSKNDKDPPVIWERMPAELKGKIAIKRKLKVKTSVKPKLSKKFENPVEILSKLEAKEKMDSDAEDENKDGKAKDDGDEDEEEKEEVEEDIEEIDEELDEGTDYANAYFDNGESYLDGEDDNLDDEPVY